MVADRSPSRDVVLAVITRPHGVRGAVCAKVFNTDTEVLIPGATLGLTPKEGGETRAVTVLDVWPAKETWVVTLEGVGSRDQAEALRGAELSIERENLPPADEDEVYHIDLLGCEVRDVTGARVGTVTEVLRYPSIDALVISREGEPLEVPWVDGIVTNVDLAARSITVDLSKLGE